MTAPQLQIYQSPPAGIFGLPASELADHLPGPSLIHLHGSGGPAIFISLLLHGNETSGWNALCDLMNTTGVDREVLVFIGNIEAAAAGVRSLPGQPDYNRIWRDADVQEARMAEDVLAYIARQRPLVAVDLHNNTGRNPHYSVITDHAPSTLGLAALFAETAVYVEEPDTVLSRALGAYCPSIAVELGPINDPASDQRALSFLSRLLDLEALPSAPVQPLAIYQALARVHIKRGIAFDFADHHHDATDLTLTAGIEGVNFHDLAAGTPFGYVRRPLEEVVTVLNPDHEDVTRTYLTVVDSRLELAREVIPAMYTTDPDVVMQDCLCYFMERMP